jgi:hypothetical protein
VVKQLLVAVKDQPGGLLHDARRMTLTASPRISIPDPT